MKIHGREKRRSWIKLHRGVDPKIEELSAIDVMNLEAEEIFKRHVLDRMLRS